MTIDEEERVFKAGWEAGYYDGGEHDCRMFTPTAESAWQHHRWLTIRDRHGEAAAVRWLTNRQRKQERATRS